LNTSKRELTAAKQVAERHGFISLLIDLLVLEVEWLHPERPADAVGCAREARRLAENPPVKDKGGHADTLDMWGRAVARLGERGFADVLLERSLGLRREPAHGAGPRGAAWAGNGPWLSGPHGPSARRP
jgi:hypothetical protein